MPACGLFTSDCIHAGGTAHTRTIPGEDTETKGSGSRWGAQVPGCERPLYFQGPLLFQVRCASDYVNAVVYGVLRFMC